MSDAADTPSEEAAGEAVPAAPDPVVRYDFEDEAPEHLPPEMYEEWRATQLRVRSERETHRKRERNFAIRYGVYGAVTALVLISFVRVSNDWLKLILAGACGLAAWWMVDHRKGQLWSGAIYGGTASVLLLSGILAGMVHPAAVALVVVYCCLGMVLAIVSANKRGVELDEF